jgi:cyclic pyranopterin phosphate synthase
MTLDNGPGENSAIENRLIDRHGRRHSYLRLSVTDRCNLRCSYCMPPHGIDWTPRAEILTAEEIVRLGAIFVGMGITKIRLTGGEPLSRRDLGAVAARLAALPGLKTLAMTTNGISLKDRAVGLRAAGIKSLTISLDTLRRLRFREIAKRDQFRAVMDGIDAALDAGFRPLKINVVVMRGVNDDEILDFVEWSKDRPLNVRFIEYMPFPDNRWSTGGLMPYAEMRARIAEHYDLIPMVGGANDVGKEFKVAGHFGTVGFVTSMTESFCGGCNRLRVTADGNIKSCLFQPAEQSLRDAMRAGAADAEIERLILAAVEGKQAAHPPMEELLGMKNRNMIEIGG